MPCGWFIMGFHTCDYIIYVRVIQGPCKGIFCSLSPHVSALCLLHLIISGVSPPRGKEATKSIRAWSAKRVCVWGVGMCVWRGGRYIQWHGIFDTSPQWRGVLDETHIVQICSLKLMSTHSSLECAPSSSAKWCSALIFMLWVNTSLHLPVSHLSFFSSYTFSVSLPAAVWLASPTALGCLGSGGIPISSSNHDIILPE